MDFLKPKKDFEEMDFQKQAGMMDLYLCVNCGANYVYTYIEAGITPEYITCVNCGNRCSSQFKKVQQPDRYWHRPKDIEEIKELVDTYWDIYKNTLYKEADETQTKAEVLKDYIQHYNSGGLFAKTLEKKK